jgi:hypothetical protein
METSSFAEFFTGPRLVYTPSRQENLRGAREVSLAWMGTDDEQRRAGSGKLAVITQGGFARAEVRP